MGLKHCMQIKNLKINTLHSCKISNPFFPFAIFTSPRRILFGLDITFHSHIFTYFGLVLEFEKITIKWGKLQLDKLLLFSLLAGSLLTSQNYNSKFSPYTTPSCLVANYATQIWHNNSNVISPFKFSKLQNISYNTTLHN